MTIAVNFKAICFDLARAIPRGLPRRIIPVTPCRRKNALFRVTSLLAGHILNVSFDVYDLFIRTIINHLGLHHELVLFDVVTRVKQTIRSRVHLREIINSTADEDVNAPGLLSGKW